jgi:hypothetical protein
MLIALKVFVTAQIISYESEFFVTSTQMEEELTFCEQAFG